MWKLYLRGQNLRRKENSKLTIKDASTDQLDALSEFMPDHDLTDSDAKILALRMYYLEFKLRTK